MGFKKMPPSRIPLPVPRFSKGDIDRANKCAVLLWNGFDYQDGARITSDETFFRYFFVQRQNVVLNGARFDPAMIHDLIITSKLKAMLRQTKQMSLLKMDRWFHRDYFNTINRHRSLIGSQYRLSVGTNLVDNVAQAVVRNGVSKSAGYRIAFSTRLLFFACPEYLIYNYSNPLGEKKMLYPSRPQVAYPRYAPDMLDGLQKNWKWLKRYNVPKPTLRFRDPIIDALRKTDWWARRVLDLALLLHFKVYSTSNQALLRLRIAKSTAQTRQLIKCP